MQYPQFVWLVLPNTDIVRYKAFGPRSTATSEIKYPKYLLDSQEWLGKAPMEVWPEFQFVQSHEFLSPSSFMESIGTRMPNANGELMIVHRKVVGTKDCMKDLIFISKTAAVSALKFIRGYVIHAYS